MKTNENLEEIIREAETKEKDSNQILDFTKKVKNISEDEKKIITNETFIRLVVFR